MKPSGRPILAAFKRAYATQAQTATGSDRVTLPKQQPKITKLGNGAILASLENYSPVSRVAVLYNAGPRYESASQKGLTHCLRSAVNLSTEKSSSFGITRGIQQIGGSLSCTTTREHAVYTLQCMRSDIDTGAEFLGHAVSHPTFRPWELKEAEARTRLDLAILEQSPEALLSEAIHQAAFRGSLGHSLYSPQHRLGFFTPDMLHSFVSKHYTSGNMAIVGLGVDHEQLAIYAKNIATRNDSAPPSPKSAYHAGQVRIENNSPLVHAAVVTEGVGMGSPDLLTLYVLQKVMGSGTYVKYGSNMAACKVTQAAAKGTNHPFAATCINATYSDTGLFGFQVVGQAADMDKILKSVAASFGEATKGTITDADVQRAKNQVKAAFMMESEPSDNFLLDFGIQALLAGQVMTPDEAAGAIDKITTADVQNVAKKIINGKPVMAAVGDLSNTPYLEQLF